VGVDKSSPLLTQSVFEHLDAPQEIHFKVLCGASLPFEQCYPRLHRRLSTAFPKNGDTSLGAAELRSFLTERGGLVLMECWSAEMLVDDSSGSDGDASTHPHFRSFNLPLIPIPLPPPPL
jgi:hypothetical protein